MKPTPRALALVAVLALPVAAVVVTLLLRGSAAPVNEAPVVRIGGADGSRSELPSLPPGEPTSPPATTAPNGPGPEQPPATTKDRSPQPTRDVVPPPPPVDDDDDDDGDGDGGGDGDDDGGDGDDD